MEKYENLNEYYKNKNTIMTFKFTDHDFNISSYKKIEKENQELLNRYQTNSEELENAKVKNRLFE